DLASIRTWLRVPYCIGAHMDREGCAFAYLSPDVDNAGQRAWLQFPQIKWHDGGLMAIACALMELAVRVVIYPTLLSDSCLTAPTGTRSRALCITSTPASIFLVIHRRPRRAPLPSSRRVAVTLSPT